MRRNYLWHMIFVFFLLCTGCNGNSISGEEAPDIAIARQGFYNETRTEFANSFQQYINKIPPDAAELLPDFTVGEFEQADLGEYLAVWDLKKGEGMWQVQLVPEENVTDQIIFTDTYMFAIMVEEKMAADYTVSIEEGEVSGASCSLNNKFRCAYDVAKANELDIRQCRVVEAPGGSMFLFYVDNGKEICSGELNKYLTDLTMSEDKVDTFKRRVAAFNHDCQESVPERAPDKPGENVPSGHTPPFF